MNRDPAEEQGGINLYGFVINNPINFWDKLGLFRSKLGFSEHSLLTYWSWNDAEIPREMKEWAIPLLRILQGANNAVDSDDRANMLEWHFNRRTNEDVLTAIRSYSRSLHDQILIYYDYLDEKTPQSCRRALITLGGVSHAWQDYYAHGIRTFSDGIIPGNIEGSPSSISPFIKPASWDHWLPWKTGEHGFPIREPSDKAPAEEKQRRYLLARNFVTEQYNSYLNIWWSFCKCLVSKIKE